MLKKKDVKSHLVKKYLILGIGKKLSPLEIIIKLNIYL